MSQDGQALPPSKNPVKNPMSEENEKYGNWMLIKKVLRKKGKDVNKRGKSNWN